MTGGAVTKRTKWPLLAWLLAAAVLLVVAAANAHLVYVAVESQPECVAHLKEAGHQGGRVPGGEARLLRKIDRCMMSGKTDERSGQVLRPAERDLQRSRRRATRRGSATCRRRPRSTG